MSYLISQRLKVLTLLLISIMFWPPVLVGQAPEGQVVVKRSRMLMGTLVFVTVVASDTETAQRAATAGLDEVRRLEELLSPWIASSDIFNDQQGSRTWSCSRQFRNL